MHGYPLPGTGFFESIISKICIKVFLPLIQSDTFTRTDCESKCVTVYWSLLEKSVLLR